MSASEVINRETDVEAGSEERTSYTRRVRRRMDQLTRRVNDALREADDWRIRAQQAERRAEKAEADLMRSLLVIARYREVLRERKAWQTKSRS